MLLIAVGAKTFDTPQQAADALVDAAEQVRRACAQGDFWSGRRGHCIYRRIRARPAARRRFRRGGPRKEKRLRGSEKRQPRIPARGQRGLAVPRADREEGDKWSFDAKAGRQELLYRRIGSNELDAIEICHGYVEAQHEYALQPREGYDVNQYAQRIVSTPGKQDGLAWQNPDGTWGGPIGEKIARAIEQGYTSRAEPYHGYFFKILKGQGPAAPLGEMDFVVKGVMIGGFALVAAPAEYGVTGVKTFIVSHDGVVYEKDFGPATLDEFKKMERFNPDRSWKPVPED